MCLEMAESFRGVSWRFRGAGAGCPANKPIGTSRDFWLAGRHLCCYSTRRSEDPPQPSPRTRDMELGGLSTGLGGISGE